MLDVLLGGATVPVPVPEGHCTVSFSRKRPCQPFSYAFRISVMLSSSCIFPPLFVPIVIVLLSSHPCTSQQLHVAHFVLSVDTNTITNYAVCVILMLSANSLFFVGANIPTGTYTGFVCLLTPCTRVFLEKLTGSQLVKKLPTIYGTRRLITAFTSARHLSLS